MTQHERNELFEKTMAMLKPALERVASDPEFRTRLELNPLAALAEMKVELDAETRRELEGKRFSEFWALRRRSVESQVVGTRDLPPTDGPLDDKQLDKVAGGRGIERFAPPYVPV